MSDIENNNSQLDDIKKQMKNLVFECTQLYNSFEEKKTKVTELRVGSGKTDFATSAWGDSAWGDSGTVNTDSWPVDNTAGSHATITGDNTGAVKYRALYEFVARNQDEISFQPGDIILVSNFIQVKEKYLTITHKNFKDSIRDILKFANRLQCILLSRFIIPFFNF